MQEDAKYYSENKWIELKNVSKNMSPRENSCTEIISEL